MQKCYLLFKNVIDKKCVETLFIININRRDLALNDLQWLIWYKNRVVMVIVVGNGHGDTSSNPGRDWLHFT